MEFEDSLDIIRVNMNSVRHGPTKSVGSRRRHPRPPLTQFIGMFESSKPAAPAAGTQSADAVIGSTPLLFRPTQLQVDCAPPCLPVGPLLLQRPRRSTPPPPIRAWPLTNELCQGRVALPMWTDHSALAVSRHLTAVVAEHRLGNIHRASRTLNRYERRRLLSGRVCPLFRGARPRLTVREETAIPSVTRHIITWSRARPCWGTLTRRGTVGLPNRPQLLNR